MNSISIIMKRNKSYFSISSTMEKITISNTIVVVTFIMAIAFIPIDSIVYVLGQSDNVSSGTATNFTDMAKQSNQTGDSMGPIGQAVEGLFDGSKGGK
jgi:hypothetical protein